ncbi:hypothetical protein [Paenibacillus macerans]|uniref:hypothetical protein n=1 Tax=Paenibacillus macerans TaxID=44252 RepID=UPI003D314126
MKWIGWLLKLCATIVAVCLLTVATTGYVVNSYVQSLLGSYNIPVTGHAPSLGGIMKGMLGLGGGGSSTEDDPQTADAGGGASADAAGKGGTSGGTGDEGQNGASGTAGTGSDSGSGEKRTDGEDVPEDALPVMGGMGSGDDLGEDQEVVVTPDDLVAKKDELPDKQKEEIFAILMSKLPQEDMQILTVALEGGLTETEMINIEQILSKHLDKTEYAKVMELLKK